jgi:hypothetical protein
MKKVPNDVMRRIFHTILCETQDPNVKQSKLDYYADAAKQIFNFLVEYDVIDNDDVYQALELYHEYSETLEKTLKPLIDEMSKKQAIV